jgi:hypothetical protein
VAIVEMLYRFGAREVLAVDIFEESTRELVIQLPEEGEGREAIFAWSGDDAERRGFERDEDLGQEHLNVFLT